MPQVDITPAKLRAWMEELHPEGPPPVGSHSIILCMSTGAVFLNKEATKAYTAATKETKFAIVWVKVDTTDDGDWTVAPRPRNAPPQAAEKKEEEVARAADRESKEKDAAKTDKGSFQSALNNVEKERAAQEEADRLEAAQLMATAAEREKLRQEALQKKLREEEAKAAADAAKRATRDAERQKARDEAKKRQANKDALDNAKHPSSEKAHKKVFGMWLNDKLVKSGNTPIKVSTLEIELQDGTVLAHLLEALTGDTLEGIDRQPQNPLQVAANFHILWDKLVNKDEIDLAGINAQNIMRDPPVLKTDLQLLWKLIEKYELEAGASDGLGAEQSLLKWAQPKTQAKVYVNDFTKDWQDGEAFVALYDDLVPGKVDWVAMDMAEPEERMNVAFQGLLNDLGVPMLLDPEDLKGSVGNLDTKQSVMTYLGAIRNAKAHQADGADKLFNDAKASYVQALLDCREKEEEIYHEAKDQIQDHMYGEGNEVDNIIADAINKLQGFTTERFVATKDAFKAAEAEYLSQKSVKGGEMAEKCREGEAEAIKHPDVLSTLLKEGLLFRKGLWRISAELEEGDAIVSETDDLMDGLVAEIATWVKAELNKNSSQESRQVVRKTATDIMNNKAEPLFVAKDHYDKAYGLADDAVVKRDALSKIQSVDDILERYNDAVAEVVNQAIRGLDSHKKQSAEELLKIYHDFSQKVEEMARKTGLPPSDAPRDPGAAEARLAEIKAMIQKDWERDCTLRYQLHVAMDQTFTNEGLP